MLKASTAYSQTITDPAKAVEFGKKVKARSLLAGGQSGDVNSKHFFDQGLMYSKGQFKDVLFYKEDVMKHVEKKYHPGE